MGEVRRVVLILKQEVGRIPLPPGQVVGLVLDGVLGRFFSTPVPPAQSLRRITGAGLILAGTGMTAWAVVERRRHTVGSFALGHPEELVTSGPYALSRHPMYLGWWMIHAGVAVFRGSSWALGTLPAGGTSWRSMGREDAPAGVWPALCRIREDCAALCRNPTAPRTLRWTAREGLVGRAVW
ncbi:methyltransferase family protein [Paenarthrobacter sp. NPDC058040]|uniref:methyltransferase family protein n=1 Tax=unclassified Paenarthrobacter TaxID=2634190 RepID=UPI0036DC2ECB